MPPFSILAFYCICMLHELYRRVYVGFHTRVHAVWCYILFLFFWNEW